MASTAGGTYTYDGDGRRVKKSNGTLYWYGIGGQLLAESDANGNIISEYIFFGGTRIARRDVSSGNVYYFLSDRLGNARILTNSTGGIVEESVNAHLELTPFRSFRIDPPEARAGVGFFWWCS